jgi:hypothetical protein
VFSSVPAVEAILKTLTTVAAFLLISTASLAQTTTNTPSQAAAPIAAGCQSASRFRPSSCLSYSLRERMLEEEPKHFTCCVRSSRISVGARRAASGPCVSGSMDIPVLQHSASTHVAHDRSGIGMSLRYLPAMHLLLCPHRSHGLLENLAAVVWMHGRVAIAVKDNGRDNWAVA